MIPHLRLVCKTIQRASAAWRRNGTPLAEQLAWAAGDGNIVSPTVETVRAQAIWREVTHGVKQNPTALMARLDALLDPERIEEANMLAAWRKRYENEITMRTKSRWWRKMAKSG